MPAECRRVPAAFDVPEPVQAARDLISHAALLPSFSTVQTCNEIAAFQSCSSASSILFPDFREEFVNSRDAAVSFIWYAIFAGGSSCGHGSSPGHPSVSSGG